MKFSRLFIAGVLTIVWVFGYVRAGPISKTANVIVSSNQQSEESIKKKTTICGKTINWVEYDKTFASIDTENEFQQILGVKWYGTDSVDFQLICGSMLCEMEISGTAIANQLEPTYRFDEDENGTYPVDEFVLKGEDSIIIIRVESESTTKARLVYSPIIRDYDCDPDNNLILKEIAIR